MRRDGYAWVGLSALLLTCALAGWGVPPAPIDWQPALALGQPWRAFSAVGVHYSGMHLLVNVGGVLLVAGFGWAARSPLPIALAWAAAWPLTQFGLLLQPGLVHYGGLSGVLHAGAAAACLGLLSGGSRAQRRVAGWVYAGLVLKVLSEAPWGPVLRPAPSLGIAVAPFAHASGVVAGTLCGYLAGRRGLRSA
ncbi:MAG: rhombosortase [Pseudomonadota bacterium]|nr:rhombosortase [Pseudomonadota bacterium]